MKSVRNSLITLALIIIVTGLVACGGGGGGGAAVPITVTTAPAEPTLILTPQSIKTFHFTWADVSGETEYRLLENPDGNSGFAQIAIIAADAVSYDLEVFLPGRINASYILQACNSAGCADSSAVFVSGNLASAVGYIKASNTGEFDMFGNVALAADGNTLAVAAPGEASNATGINGNQADNSAINSGAVYIFTRSGSTWSQQAYLKASNAEADDYFGITLDLSSDGNTLAVGAFWEDSNAAGINGDQTDNSASSSGAVYVFTRSGSTWSQQAYVKASNAEAGDFFGNDVALSADGNTLAVGAYFEASSATGINGNQADNSGAYSGAVYVFTRSGSTWSQQAYIKASNTEAYDAFGFTVALSADGSTLAVGAYGEASSATGINGNQADNSAAYSGAVYVFTRNGDTWSQQAYVKASNTDTSDLFCKVALSADGNTLAVGAYDEASNATGINGNQADNSAGGSGAVYIFTRSGSTWSQQAYVKASNTDVSDHFGLVTLSADGNTLAVGASNEGSSATGINGNQADDTIMTTQSGAVYIFTRSGSTWSQRAYVKASNTGFGDRFAGNDLSADGNIMAVGAFGEASSATGINGDQADNLANGSGAVYLF